jgi:hypothetical protein
MYFLQGPYITSTVFILAAKVKAFLLSNGQYILSLQIAQWDVSCDLALCSTHLNGEWLKVKAHPTELGVQCILTVCPELKMTS